jgi:hypothetical protein
MARGAARRSAADAVDSDSEISYRFASRLLPYRYTWKIVPLARSKIRMSRGAAFVGGEGAAGIFMSERRLGFFKSYVRGDPRRSGFEEIYNSRRESESGVSRELTLEAACIAASRLSLWDRRGLHPLKSPWTAAP